MVLSQEALHSLKHKSGVKGGLAVKIDLEKAYDRLDWDFLEQVLKYSSLMIE